MDFYGRLKIDMKALLQSAGRMGLTVAEIERDFFDLFHRPAPYRECGFNTLHDMLVHMADVVLVIDKDESVGRPTLYYPISDERTQHLEKLIEKQRVHQPTRFGGVLTTAEDAAFLPRRPTTSVYTNPFTGEPSQRPSAVVPKLSDSEINQRSLAAVLNTLDQQVDHQRPVDTISVTSEAGSETTIVADPVGANTNQGGPSQINNPGQASIKSVATAGPPPSRQRHSSAVTTTTVTPGEAGYEFPEDAPIILPNQLRKNTQIPHSLWQNVYAILRDCGDKWMDVRQFQSEYARRMKKPLSSEYLLKTCNIRQYKQLFVDLPWVDYKYTPDDVMYVRLVPPWISRKSHKMHDGNPKNLDKRVPEGERVDTNMFLNWYDDEDYQLKIPPQPTVIKLPHKKARLPLDFRKRVYHLLWGHYRNGVDISTFAESYTKRYGCSISTETECGMNLESSMTFMADLVDTGRAPDGRLYIRPVHYSFVKQLYKKWKDDEVEKLKRWERANVVVENDINNPRVVQMQAPSTVVDEPEMIRKECRSLLRPYRDGLEVEKMAILYQADFPYRDLGCNSTEEFVQFLKTSMRNEMEIFPSVIKGRQALMVKLMNPK